MSDRIARAFHRSGATRAVALDVSTDFEEFGMLVFFTYLSVIECRVSYLALIPLFSAIGSFRYFWMGILQGSTLGPTLFLLYNNDFPDDVICGIAIYADTTLYSKCDQAFDLWQQLESVSELESDL